LDADNYHTAFEGVYIWGTEGGKRPYHVAKLGLIGVYNKLVVFVLNLAWMMNQIASLFTVTSILHPDFLLGLLQHTASQ